MWFFYTEIPKESTKETVTYWESYYITKALYLVLKKIQNLLGWISKFRKAVGLKSYYYRSKQMKVFFKIPFTVTTQNT